MFSKYRSLMKNLSFTVMASSVLLVTGCASSNVEFPEPLTQEEQKVENRGLVVARLIDAQGNFLHINRLTLTPKSINETNKEKYQRLQAKKSHQRGNSVFTGFVKPGHYSVADIGYFYMLGDIPIANYLNTDARFGTFEVKAGQVTDLGTIIYYPNPDEDNIIHTLTRAGATEVGEALQRHYPFFKFDKSSVLTWDKDDSIDAHEERYASIVQNPITLFGASKETDNSLTFLAPLGAFITRDANNNWELDAVESNMPITAHGLNADGSRIVGGYEGSLFYKSAQGEWQNFSIDTQWTFRHLEFLDNETVLAMRHNETQLILEKITLTSNGMESEELNAFSNYNYWTNYDKNDREKRLPRKKKARKIIDVGTFYMKDQWLVTITMQRLRTEDLVVGTEHKEFVIDRNDYRASLKQWEDSFDLLQTSGDELVGLNYPGFFTLFGGMSYHLYDPKTEQWLTLTEEVRWCGDHEVTTSKKCENGKKSKTSDFKFASGIVVNDKREIFTTVLIDDFAEKDKDGNAKLQYHLLKSIDNGNTWAELQTQLPAERCGFLMPNANESLLLGCMYTSDFYESTDEGRTWEHVRQQEAF